MDIDIDFAFSHASKSGSCEIIAALPRVSCNKKCCCRIRRGRLVHGRQIESIREPQVRAAVLDERCQKSQSREQSHTLGVCDAPKDSVCVHEGKIHVTSECASSMLISLSSFRRTTTKKHFSIMRTPSDSVSHCSAPCCVAKARLTFSYIFRTLGAWQGPFQDGLPVVQYG